ncbi:MAG: fumarate hydratase [Clostridiaceae bacterium]|nr:fumarate hydratase [Clostridiaceae bacterium]
MRVIDASLITDTVENLCIAANYCLGNDMLDALKKNLDVEESDEGIYVIEKIIENANLACTEQMAICQDAGMAVVFVEIGQDVHVTGKSLGEAINEGVGRGYKKGYLRNSVVGDPVERVNTGDNTPAVIHYDIVEGDKIKVTVVPKGFGSENMSALEMLKPADGIDGIKRFVIKTVDRAGPNPCPPVVVGVGIGGTMEKAAYLAKKALTRPVNVRNSAVHIRDLEIELLREINMLGIGPMGLGGRITALAVNIEVFPTHIAGLPVAVNMSCHATRHAEAVL